jgi:mannose-6-phosphate isomerase-like protein (cupin superfamily)
MLAVWVEQIGRRGMKTLMVGAMVLGLQLGAAHAQTSGTNPLASARVFLYEDMPVRTTANGGEGRSVFNGTLATGEAVGAHESMQPVGAPPSALHAIHHSEVIVVQQGTVEFHHDGKAERVGPGGIIYVAIGTEHFVKNVGEVPAKYVVIQIGGDTKK